MAPDRPLLRLSGVSRIYGHGETVVRALDRVDLEIPHGDFVAIMGPSGSGKSTAMNILGCLDLPTQGHFFFRGVDVSRLTADQRALLRRHYIGFVFQGFNLLKRTTALENVELPLVYRGLPARQRREQARSALEAVGLQDRMDHTSTELSGGQQQRVAIARAIASEPSVLFADEPTGNLDSERSTEIMTVLADLNRDKALTVVVVTHEPDMAAFAPRHIHFLDGRIDRDERTEHRRCS